MTNDTGDGRVIDSKDLGIDIQMYPQRSIRFTPHEGEAFPEAEALKGTYLAVSRKDIPGLIDEYLGKMKVGRTIDWCACEWMVHPEDIELPPDIDECKSCGGKELEHPRNYTVSYRRPGTLDDVTKSMTCVRYQQRQRRLHRQHESPQCPVHTEAGRILGFFHYLFPSTMGPNPAQLKAWLSTVAELPDADMDINAAVTPFETDTAAEVLREEPDSDSV